jgi:hypothetical protein
VLNVGDSAHAQLESARQARGARRGVDTSVAEEGDAALDELGLPAPEFHHKLLKMKLSDGHRFIIGMEFKPLPQIRVDVPPGAKICVKKGTPIRRGLLLLQPSNTQFLQGEVAAMARDNNYVRVLERCFA